MGKLAQHLHLGVRGLVSIELERPSFEPGETIVGTVRLIITKPIDQAQLIVTLHGEQRLRWNTQNGNGKSPHSIAVEHLHQTIHLTDPNTSFEPGEQVYPISFQLPSRCLAPSLSYSRGHVNSLEDVRVTVAYAVEAKLMVDAFTAANLCSSAPFTIPFPTCLSMPIPRPMAVQRQDDVKILGLLRRGSCSINVTLASNVFDANATIEAHVTLHLETTRQLKYVLLALYEEATIDRQRKRRLKCGSRIVGRRRIEATSLGSSFPLETTLRLPITPNDIYKFTPLLPTLQNEFLALNYSVAVECHFGMGSTVKAVVPVSIITVDIPVVHIVAA